MLNEWKIGVLTDCLPHVRDSYKCSVYNNYSFNYQMKQIILLSFCWESQLQRGCKQEVLEASTENPQVKAKQEKAELRNRDWVLMTLLKCLDPDMPEINGPF